MNINTIFRTIVGRDINLTNVNYGNAYESEDIKAATALMFILQKFNYKVPQNYSFAYNEKRGIYSHDLVEDVLEQALEIETNVEMGEELIDLFQQLHLSVDSKRKITSGLTSAVQYHYYSDWCRPTNRSEQDYLKFFPQRHPKESYKLGKQVWKSINAYEKARQEAQKADKSLDQAQPE